MALVDDLLDALAPDPAPGLSVTWGVVRSTAPLKVQFAGDTSTTGTPIALRNNAYAPALSDKVKLERVGRQWVCAYRMVAS